MVLALPASHSGHPASPARHAVVILATYGTCILVVIGMDIAIAKAGYTGKVVVGMDVAASKFYDDKDKTYHLNFKEENNDESQKILGDNLKNVYKSYVADYPIVSIEDPFDQDDWEHHVKLIVEVGQQVHIVSDDLLFTNPKRVDKAIKEKVCNALLLKV
ncbi:enolase-like [Glycine soja]|uniref:enolase-like n=1 Tax=Glycine soja TaxID=3848 RepID=UPI001040053E|nr:enolase-like [Glycine soja]XP_040870602.1 enolase-like [Glycine max]